MSSAVLSPAAPAAIAAQPSLSLDPHSRLNAIRWSLRLYGPIGTARLLSAKLRGQTGDGDEYALFRDRLADRRLGIETASPVQVADLQVDADARAHAVEYRPTSSLDAALMLSRLPVDRARTHFLDLGCGKGRIVALASAMGFAASTGVEFDPSLAETARRNLLTCRLPSQGAAAIITGDARETFWPSAPLVVYLYNPFGRPILEQTLARLTDSLRRDPRPCHVLYANPQHADAFDTPAWQRGQTGDDWWELYRWRQ